MCVYLSDSSSDSHRALARRKRQLANRIWWVAFFDVFDVLHDFYRYQPRVSFSTSRIYHPELTFSFLPGLSSSTARMGASSKNTTSLARPSLLSHSMCPRSHCTSSAGTSSQIHAGTRMAILRLSWGGSLARSRFGLRWLLQLRRCVRVWFWFGCIFIRCVESIPSSLLTNSLQRTTIVLGQAALEAGQMGMVKGSRSKGTTTKVASSKNSSTSVAKAAGVEDLIRNRSTDVTRDPGYRNAVLRIGTWSLVLFLIVL